MYQNLESLYSHEQKCAGKNCANEGKHQLTILYLNKIGWFCDSCKEDLVSENLVILDNTIGVENGGF